MSKCGFIHRKGAENAEAYLFLLSADLPSLTAVARAMAGQEAMARQGGRKAQGKIIYLCAPCGSAVNSGHSKGMRIFIVTGPYQNKLTTSLANQTAKDFSLYTSSNLT
jgi:hypothetical protein